MTDVTALDPIIIVAEPAAPPPAEPVLTARQDAPVEPTPVTPAARPAGFTRYVPLVAVSLAVVASGISATGLIIASRTLAETRTLLQDIRAEQASTQELSQLLADVRALRERQQLNLSQVEAARSEKPVTEAQMRGAINALQLTLGRQQGPNNGGTLALLRDGQAELAERISVIYRRVERIDEKIGRLVSSSPKARRAAD